MFVTRARYDEAISQRDYAARMALAHLRDYNSVVSQWNALIARIEQGELVLASSRPAQFTPEELDTLVRLCHPDKHDGSRAANDMTAKLLAMRKKP